MEYQLAGIQRVEYFGDFDRGAVDSTLRALSKRGVNVRADASNGGKRVNLEDREGFRNSGGRKGDKKRRYRILTALLLIIVTALLINFLFRSSNNETTATNENLPPSSISPGQTNVEKGLSLIHI